MSNQSDYYAWKVAQEAIEKFIEPLNSFMLYEGWVKAQLIIEAQARYYAHTGYPVEIAVSMAWEDFDMACRGRSEPGITGAVFMLWSRSPNRYDKALRKTLESAFLAARTATKPNKLRFHPKDYAESVKTLDDDFDLPEAIPIIHVPVLQAINNAKDLKSAINQISDFSAEPFTLIEGGRDATPSTNEDLF